MDTWVHAFSLAILALWPSAFLQEPSATPVACRLLAALRGKEGGVAAPLLRGGYSAVAAKGRLRPHFGTSNAQLKWHLGPLDSSEQSVGQV